MLSYSSRTEVIKNSLLVFSGIDIVIKLFAVRFQQTNSFKRHTQLDYDYLFNTRFFL